MVRGKGVGPVQGPIGTGTVAIQSAMVVRRWVDGRGRVVDAHRKLTVDGATPLNALHLLAAAVHRVSQVDDGHVPHADLPVTNGAGPLWPWAPFLDALTLLVAPWEAALAADALSLGIRGREATATHHRRTRDYRSIGT